MPFFFVEFGGKNFPIEVIVNLFQTKLGQFQVENIHHVEITDIHKVVGKLLIQCPPLYQLEQTIVDEGSAIGRILQQAPQPIDAIVGVGKQLFLGGLLKVAEGLKEGADVLMAAQNLQQLENDALYGLLIEFEIEELRDKFQQFESSGFGVDDEQEAGEKQSQLSIDGAEENKKLNFHSIGGSPEQIVVIHVVDADFYPQVLVAHLESPARGQAEGVLGSSQPEGRLFSILADIPALEGVSSKNGGEHHGDLVAIIGEGGFGQVNYEGHLKNIIQNQNHRNFTEYWQFYILITGCISFTHAEMEPGHSGSTGGSSEKWEFDQSPQLIKQNPIYKNFHIISAIPPLLQSERQFLHLIPKS